MGYDFSSVNLSRDMPVEKGDYILYTVDFNIGYTTDDNPRLKDFERVKLKDSGRLDIEVPEIKALLEKKARVGIYGSKGRFSDGSAEHLDFMVGHLAAGLEKIEGVTYYPESVGEEARNYFKNLSPSEVAIMGCTRMYKGEQENDPDFSRELANLIPGQNRKIVMGGPGKSHREESSTNGILDYIPGYLAESQVQEMNLLSDWSGKRNIYSVAVLGGIKKEKITIGLKGFLEIYDAVIPGGIVLNTILAAQGHPIGGSVIKDGGKNYINFVRDLLDGPNAHKIHLPEEIVIARKKVSGFADVSTIPVGSEFSDDFMIVGFEPGKTTNRVFNNVRTRDGRMVVAGTPDFYTAGFTRATDTTKRVMDSRHVKAIAVGGDTGPEIGYPIFSTGGGSSLGLMIRNTTAVFEKLKENKLRFPNT